MIQQQPEPWDGVDGDERWELVESDDAAPVSAGGWDEARDQAQQAAAGIVRAARARRDMALRAADADPTAANWLRVVLASIRLAHAYRALVVAVFRARQRRGRRSVLPRALATWLGVCLDRAPPRLPALEAVRVIPP